MKHGIHKLFLKLSIRLVVNKRLFLALIPLLPFFSLMSSMAQPAGRDTVRLSHGWQFIRNDMANTWEVWRPVKAGKPESVPLWQEVTLPHCYNALDAVDPDVNYYQGPAWYRTHIHVANHYPHGRTLLVFEGSGQKTDVFIGQRKVGSHVGGYDRWQIDITDAGHGELPLAVRCDNSRDVEMIPSDMSDFNLYGGLYRPVSLVYRPAAGVDDVRIDATASAVTVTPLLTGNSDNTLITLRIYHPNGKLIHSQQQRGTACGRPMHIVMKRPQLWSPDTPYLYRCEVEAVADGQHSTVSRHFGLRSYEFREHGPFMLNGQRLLLHGTHRHDDHAGVGAAMTEEQTRRELHQIKQMGANFIRLGHYQQSELVLHLCDSLGLLVWEEIPWCRGGLGGERYRQQARNMLTAMINQHRHHPSIILWGLGNENDWPGDFAEFEQDSIRAFMSELNTLAHQLDNSRLTTIRRCDFCSDITDVYSPSIWAGWYSRRYTNYREMSQQAIARHPRFFHAEWGGDSHAGRHTEYPTADGRMPADTEAGDRNGDWSESYIVRLFDWHLKEQQSMDSLTGSAFWTFKDFSTPLRPDNPIPYVNQKGVVERDGTPKESYYVFQSYWSKQPMLHIYGHSWPVRWGKAGQTREVLVYSNCPEVELFVNGLSAGRRQRRTTDFPAQGFHWDVCFREGTNVVRAVAGKLTDEIIFDYQTATWGAPAEVRLRTLDEQSDTLLVEAQLYDAKGIRCLDAANRITFSVAGDAQLFDNQGTSTGTRRIQAANGRALMRIHRSGACAVGATAEDVSRSGLLVLPE